VLVGLPGPLVTPASYRRPQPSRCAAERAELSRLRLLPPSAVLSCPPGTPSAPLLPPPSAHRAVRRRSIASQASAPPSLHCFTGQCAAVAPVLHRPVRQPPLRHCSSAPQASAPAASAPVLHTLPLRQPPVWLPSALAAIR
jgi:hypothetical protein